MADLNVIRAYRDGDAIIVEGAGFTKTTTAAFDDADQEVNFDWVSEGVIRINGDIEGVKAITIVKGETEQTVDVEGESETSEPEPETSEPEPDDGVIQGSSDIDPDDLDQAANAGADEKPAPLQEGEHLPGDDFRAAVENTAAGDLDQDPREPYATGNPPDPRESFHRIWGFYPPDEGGGEQANQMDADPAT